MTDDEKLARISALEEGFWESLNGSLDSEWLHKNIASIERCQRIRANLRIQQSYLEQDQFDAETARVAKMLKSHSSPAVVITEPTVTVADSEEWRRYRQP